ncbi:MAG: hypothetical protein QW409_02290 [Candidatus Aenigmatarchaeota archaeon]
MNLVKIPTEDACLAVLIDKVVNKECVGYEVGSWSHVISILNNNKNADIIIGVIDNDNRQEQTLRNENWKEYNTQIPKVKVFYKDFNDGNIKKRYIIVFDRNCEDFLGISEHLKGKNKDKIKDKFNKAIKNNFNYFNYKLQQLGELINNLLKDC